MFQNDFQRRFLYFTVKGPWAFLSIVFCTILLLFLVMNFSYISMDITLEGTMIENNKSNILLKIQVNLENLADLSVGNDVWVWQKSEEKCMGKIERLSKDSVYVRVNMKQINDEPILVDVLEIRVKLLTKVFKGGGFS